MATYNSTIGSTAIAAIHTGRHFVADILIDVPTIIAAHATLTANAKITAADIIQIWDIPDNVVLVSPHVLHTITIGQAGNTADIGIAGGDEMFDGVSLVATAETLQVNLVGDDWGPDNVTGVSFNATDTLDMKFVADATTGRYRLLVGGFIIPAV